MDRLFRLAAIAALTSVSSASAEQVPSTPPDEFARWQSFARTAHTVDCTLDLGSVDPSTRRLLGQFDVKLTAYRWATRGWVLALQVEAVPWDHPRSSFVWRQSVGTASDVPTTPYDARNLTTPVRDVPGVDFVSWAYFFGRPKWPRPVLKVGVHGSGAGVSVPLTCRARP